MTQVFKQRKKILSVKLKLDYLNKIYAKAEVKQKENINYNNKYNHYKTKKKEVCKLFIKGSCKYGDKCRFLHEKPAQNIMSHTDEEDVKYELEIRFHDTLYPYSVPLLFFKTETLTKRIPTSACLKITARLIDEAKVLAQDGIPSIYSLVELLSNEEDIVNFLKFDDRLFPEPSDTLFPQLLENNEDVKKPLPSHYKRGSAKDVRANVNLDQIIKENIEIAKRWQDKSNDKYNKMMSIRRKLPAWQKRHEILKTINKSQVQLHLLIYY